MTFNPLPWRSPCEHNSGGWHIWMCYSHNNGWKQLGVFCIRCGRKSYTSDRQWKMYVTARDNGEAVTVTYGGRQ